MFRQVFIAATLAAGLLLTGCASIMKGQNQSLSVVSKNDGAELAGAKCELANSKGIWYVTTPGSVAIHRAYGDMTVTCKAEGLPDGIATVKSSTTGAVFGNILVGGGLGAGIDIATGAAYDYPLLIAVSMGKTLRLETSSDGESRPIDPLEKVPYLDEAKQVKYREFLTRPSPRAFAVSINGNYGDSWNEAQPGRPLPTDRKEQAMAQCKQFAGQDCELYVVDELVVFSAKPAATVPAVPVPPSTKPVPLK
jgi:hypothetical protein